MGQGHEYIKNKSNYYNLDDTIFVEWAPILPVTIYHYWYSRRRLRSPNKAKVETVIAVTREITSRF